MDVILYIIAGICSFAIGSEAVVTPVIWKKALIRLSILLLWPLWIIGFVLYAFWMALIR